MMTATTTLADAIRALSRFDTPTIANAMEALKIAPRQFTGPEIRSMGLDGPAVGVAFTGTMKEQWGKKFAHLEPWLRFLEEIERCEAPVIAVLHDDSTQPGREAILGEGMARSMRAAGAIGVVCDGTVRDLNALHKIGFAAWAAGCSADRGRIRFHRLQVPVTVGGMTVLPGEIIHADVNGALVVPPNRISEIALAAEGVSQREAKMFAMIGEPGFRVARLLEFYADALASARSEYEQASGGSTRG